MCLCVRGWKWLWRFLAGYVGHRLTRDNNNDGSCGALWRVTGANAQLVPPWQRSLSASFFSSSSKSFSYITSPMWVRTLGDLKREIGHRSQRQATPGHKAAKFKEKLFLCSHSEDLPTYDAPCSWAYTRRGQTKTAHSAPHNQDPW